MSPCSAYVRERGDALRRAVAEALSEVGSPAVPALVQALGDGDKDVRSAACRALGAIGDASAVPALINALGDEYSWVRFAACEALGAIGDAAAVPDLIKALRDEDSDGVLRRCKGDWGMPLPYCGCLRRARPHPGVAGWDWRCVLRRERRWSDWDMTPPRFRNRGPIRIVI